MSRSLSFVTVHSYGKSVECINLKYKNIWKLEVKGRRIHGDQNVRDRSVYLYGVQADLR
jgi:hypothetical protein